MTTKRDRRPACGWNIRRGLVNPRPPAVPATLNLTLEEYYAAAGAIGLLSSQLDEPDKHWASQWALEFGEIMAGEAKKKRRGKRRRT